MAAEKNKNDVVISPRDILFECPACHKSLVIDEAAQGMIVDCPRCKTSVIVPPKGASAPASGAEPKGPVAAAEPSKPLSEPAQPAGEPAKPVPEPSKAVVDASVGELLNRLVTLGNQLKELQTQRTEIATNVAARLNEVNRQMVMLARQETAHHQVLQEWSQILGKIRNLTPKPTTDSAQGGKSQVNFKA